MIHNSLSQHDNTLLAVLAPEMDDAAMLVAQLRVIEQELGDFGHREEQQFLHIGSSLGDFHRRATATASQAEEIAISLTAREGEGASSALLELLDGLDFHLEEVARRAEDYEQSLGGLIAALERLDAPLVGLAKVVKVLQALSFSTRIESTHGESGKILCVLADNLKELGQKIGTKTERVRTMIETIVALGDAARDKVQSVRGVSFDQTRQVVLQTRTAIDELSYHLQQAGSRTVRLSRRSREIADSTGEVVMSVQFHDITRQQIEHVRVALDELCGQLTAGHPADEQRHLVTGVCRIQSAQLRHTRGELVAAVTRIMENLTALAENVEALSRDCREVSGAGAGAENDATIFTDLEPVVRSVATVLEHSEAINNDAKESIIAVLAAMNELSTLLGAIELIGTEMKLIAFNAGITAAHNMERGAGLGVIADSIQTLSGQVMNRTVEFSKGFHEMSGVVERLAARAGTAGGYGDDQALSHNAGKLCGELQDINRRLANRLHEIDRQAREFAGDIRDTVAGISVHIDAARILDRAQHGLERLCLTEGGAEAPEHSLHLFERLSQRYTMQSERDIHHQVASSAKRSERRIELDSPSGAADDLGANVELF